MAKQVGILPISGAIDTITFTKSRNGYKAGKKTSLNGQKIANNPAFLFTRLNNIEFTRAAKAATMIQDAVGSFQSSDKRVFPRLNKALLQVIKSDNVNPRGERNLMAGDFSTFKDFDFNITHPLNSILKLVHTTSINRMTGELKVSFPSYIPNLQIIAPTVTSHYKLGVAGIALDFDGNSYVADIKESALLSWNAVATAPLELTTALPVASPNPLMVILCIQFFEQKGGVLLPIANRAWNGMRLVGLDVV